MIKISPFTPLFFNPSSDKFGAESKYVQLFSPSDNIFIQVLTSTEYKMEGYLIDKVHGSKKAIEFQSFSLKDDTIVFHYTLTGLLSGYYSVLIGDQECDTFKITDDEQELKKTTLIRYSMRNNKQRNDCVFWNDDTQFYFEFRAPGGFKDDDWTFGVSNEQFEIYNGDIVELFAIESTQKKFTLGNSEGCPVWFAEHLNRILCCSNVSFNGTRFVRKGSSVPEMTQEIVSLKSYIFKVSLQGMVDNIDIDLPEGGETEGGETEGGGTGSGGEGYIYLIRLNDTVVPTDRNTYSSLRILAEINKAVKANNEELKDMFLRKDQSDGTPHTLTIGKDLKFGDFISMLQGGYIDKFGDAELRRLVLRESLSVPEIRFNRMTYFEGYNVISPGGGFLIKEVVDNGDGTYTITPDREDGEPIGQFADDILTGYWHNFADGVGDIKGFGKVQFRVSSVDYEAKTAVLTPKPDTSAVPKSQMRLAQTGSFTNDERQTYIVIDTRDGNSCITFYDHANTWDPEPAQEMSWLGKKKGRTVHGIPADNYSAVLRNIIMSGKIFQVDDITGEAFRVPLNKGAWSKDKKNAYYDEVSHNGSLWLCVNPNGTTSEPSDTNPDWLKSVAKGTDGANGTGISSTDVEYAVSSSSDVAPTTGWQTTSPTWTDGKYIWSRTKITYSNGKVTYTNPACITGSTGGTGNDGKGIKSIVEQYYLSSSATTTTGGEWQTASPAWKNGWYIWTRSVITYTDNTTLTTNAICVTGGKGADGTSITNCGDWHTGLHVPYMGLTKMANRVFLCKNPVGTDNPPMWVNTDKDGNRILQTQDGGKNYGYILTGDLNTAEYELLVENGKDGRDGKDHEWIFKHTTENVAPSTPGTSQVDDYVPPGWHDNAIGVSETLPYEWACARTKKDGVWSAFTPAAIWAKWGFDGQSVIMADFDNEMESIALTHEGKTTAAITLKTTVSIWYGIETLQLKSIVYVLPNNVTASHDLNTGIITFAIASGVSMPDLSQVKITLAAAHLGVDYSRELNFSIAGVRAGNPGTDAVLYRLVPSVTSVTKRKDGTYSVGSISCSRTKTVGQTTAVTNDGVLKYSKDGGSEEFEIYNTTFIAPVAFTKYLQFIYYINGQVVDRETVPMVVDGTDGESIKGDQGTSIKAGGEWRTPASPIPALTIVTMGYGSWLSKVATSNPPMWVVTDKNGNRILQTQDGGKTYGYILTGEVNNTEWEKLTEDGMVVYLVSTVSNIRVSNAGSLVPSAFKVYAKRSVGSTTLSYSDGYLAARGYSNGIWSTIAGPARSSELTVNASAGYSTFSVRCYQNQGDATAWNDNFVAEQSVGVSYDGGIGKTGSEPRPRGLFANGNIYVWNERFHDVVLAIFNDQVIPFRVRAYGTTVTVAPTSIEGDANWESAQQFEFIATDFVLSRLIRADEIFVDELVVQNVKARDENGNITVEIDGKEKIFRIGNILINSEGLGVENPIGILDSSHYMSLKNSGLSLGYGHSDNIDNVYKYEMLSTEINPGSIKINSKSVIYPSEDVMNVMSDNCGLKVNDRGVFKTSDGGKTWIQL